MGIGDRLNCLAEMVKTDRETVAPVVDSPRQGRGKLKRAEERRS